MATAATRGPQNNALRDACTAACRTREMLPHPAKGTRRRAHGPGGGEAVLDALCGPDRIARGLRRGEPPPAVVRGKHSVMQEGLEGGTSLAWEMEEGATRRGTWAASRSWKGRGKESSSGASKEQAALPTAWV